MAETINMQDIGRLLEDTVARVNTPAFIADDPVQFPRRFYAQSDVEIVALLSACMAWGRRPQILKDCERLLTIMEQAPTAYVRSGEWHQIADTQPIHRTMRGAQLKYMLAGLQLVLSRYGTLEALCAEYVPQGAESAPWLFAEALHRLMLEANDGRECVECIPSRMDTTALKRINMALRWLVRHDGIVDMGLWSALRPSQLYIPLDVHVARISRELGLLQRRSNDRKAVCELTERLRTFCPEDPVKYDFALFGIGVANT